MTVWPARRVKDRILCGRPAPDGGCRGVIAVVVYVSDARRALRRALERGFRFRTGLPDVAWVVMEAGMTEDPPGSHFWRSTVRGERRHADKRRVAARGERGIETYRDPSTGIRERHRTTRDAPELPFRRRCPVCNTVAEVTDSLLE